MSSLRCRSFGYLHLPPFFLYSLQFLLSAIYLTLFFDDFLADHSYCQTLNRALSNLNRERHGRLCPAKKKKTCNSRRG
ncbi:hypothetical protein COLO4_30222 [Corchorus olitorius]|uniref:Uncharacterized protein n=1 Tax=Corchorus olitorius TaxID=93759 RepID=A0A1R3H9T3_9ROSI|nr:hypothetical protein COLO4_30222 [Corchorus olitorius]